LFARLRKGGEGESLHFVGRSQTCCDGEKKKNNPLSTHQRGRGGGGGKGGHVLAKNARMTRGKNVPRLPQKERKRGKGGKKSPSVAP